MVSVHARTVVVGAVIAALVAACANPIPSGTSPSTGAPSPRTSASPARSAAADLVGEWQRETRCEEVVAALRSRGLDQWVPEVASGFVPGASTGAELADPDQPCNDAIPLRHSHFFTEAGLFGSRDEEGNQVDDGTYRIVDERTFIVSKEFPDVTFHYAVDGDTITFDPVIPECAPDCFEGAWSVTVAYPGLPWVRVDVR